MVTAPWHEIMCDLVGVTEDSAVMLPGNDAIRGLRPSGEAEILESAVGPSNKKIMAMLGKQTNRF